MPYDFDEDHPKCEAGEIALVQSETGEFFGCHPNEDSARDQIAVIEQQKRQPMQSEADHVVGPSGGAVKDLDDKGTFGGYLVRFGGPKEHDLEKDFFTKETDFWLEEGSGESAGLWAHGTDPKIGKKRIDKGWASVKVDDEGVWMETQLQKRNQYEEAIQKLAEKGKLGLSSGTASHLVERERTKEGPKGVTHIKQWPLGLDASFTPTPAEPRTKVQPLKSVSVPSIKTLMNGTEGEFGIQAKAENFESVEAAIRDMKAVSLREKRRLIKADFRQKFRGENTNSRAPRVKAVFDSFVIARGTGDESGTLYRISYSGSVQQGYEFAERSDWTEVVKTEQFTERSVAKGVEEDLKECLQIVNGRKQPELGGRVAAAREEAGLTQAELVAGTPISRSMLAKIENGKVGNPSEEALAAIANKLPGITLSQLRNPSSKSGPQRSTNDPEPSGSSGTGESSGSKGGEDLESELESLVDLTS